MGIKRGNLKFISGLLLPSFILNYILIRVKKEGLNKKIERTREKGRIERGREKQSLGNCLLDHESSVEVGYGFHAFIVNS